MIERYNRIASGIPAGLPTGVKSHLTRKASDNKAMHPSLATVLTANDQITRAGLVMAGVGRLTKNFPNFPNCSTMVFFRGEYVFRSMNGVFAALVLVVFGGLFVWVSSQCLKSGTERLDLFVGVAFAIWAALFLGASIYVMIAILIGRRDQVIISVDGITNGRRFIPWREISELYGTIHTNGVCIAYTTANRKIYIERKLSTTPLLTAAAYQKLAETIRDGISREQSHVRIDIRPRRPAGD